MAEPTRDMKVLQSLTYLNAVINETLRLWPAPTSGLRQTPPEGVVVAGRYIPGDTTVLTPGYSLARGKPAFILSYPSIFILLRLTIKRQDLLRSCNRLYPRALDI